MVEFKSSAEETHQRQLAVTLVHSAKVEERIALAVWAQQLLEIRSSEATVMVKARKAIVSTRESHVIWPSVKILGREVKRFAWDDRGLAARFGLGGAAVGLAVFGGQGAGIAALGTAIGVPLWVVFGSGAAFAGVLIEEATRKSSDVPLSTYQVIESKKEEG